MLSFSERLKELRTENNLTQVKVAAAIEISGRGYIDLENGKSKPKYDNVIRLAHYFNVSLDYLAGRVDDMASAVFSIQAQAALSDDRLTTDEKCFYLQLCYIALNGKIKIVSEDAFCDKHSFERATFCRMMKTIMELKYISIGEPSDDEAPGIVYILEENSVILMNRE